MSDYYFTSTIMSPLFATGHLDAGTTYPRIAHLKHQKSDGILLATCDQGQMIDDHQVWPIFISSDFGKTWCKVLDFQNPHEEYPLQMNPVIYEIPEGTKGFDAGDILLSGILKPADISKTFMPIYLSKDLGKTWRWLTDIDTGGPAIYDHNTDADTTAIWEPFFFVNSFGNLSIAYSDERLKKDNILQALVLRYFDLDTNSWSEIVPMVAIPDGKSRPGMISVTQLENGSYVGVYEIVNTPSVRDNFAEVYISFSNDGLHWDYDQIGTRVETKDGSIPGSSPYITSATVNDEEWIVVSGKWKIKNHGIQNLQDVFINKRGGKGFWERFPMPVTYDCIKTQVENTAYSQSIMPINNGLAQLVTVNNEITQLNDLVYGYKRFPDFSIVEFSQETSKGVYQFDEEDAASGVITELHDRGELTVELSNNDAIHHVGMRYRNVSNPSTLVVNYENTQKIIYLEKTHKQFKWVFFSVDVDSTLDQVVFKQLTGSKLIEIERLDFYK